MITAVKKTTPFSPIQWWMPAIFASYSHSHAYQVCPPMVTENGSTRVIECVRSIRSPLRMCHPMLASPSRRGARAPLLMANSRMMNIRSVMEGARNRNHAGGGALSEGVSISAVFESKMSSHQPDMLPDRAESMGAKYAALAPLRGVIPRDLVVDSLGLI